MNNPVIQTTDITKVFGTLHAVDKVNLRINRCEIYGLVGPSGAGKTTLIRLLCGLSSATVGEAMLLGRSIPGEKSAIEAQIGYMPQEQALYRDLTVLENLHFFGRLYNMPGRKINHRTESLLDLMSMSPLANQRADKLSGGEKQRLSLACALLHDPDLLLLDEPTIGLDPKLRMQFWDHFHHLSRQGRTILLTTHYLEEANRCKRVGMMKSGQIIAEGAPAKLQDRVEAETGRKSPSMEQVFLYFTQQKRR